MQKEKQKSEVKGWIILLRIHMTEFPTKYFNIANKIPRI